MVYLPQPVLWVRLVVTLLYRGVEVSDCGRYVVCAIRHGCDPVNRLYFCYLHSLTEGITGLSLSLSVVKS